jgi:myosin-1
LLARIEASQRKKGVVVIRDLINGFIHRKDPIGPENSRFLSLSLSRYFERAGQHLPKDVLDTRWIPDAMVPSYASKANDFLRHRCYLCLSQKYRQELSPEKKAILQLKLEASEIFLGKKASYPHSVGIPFQESRIQEIQQLEVSKSAYSKVKGDDEVDQPLYASVMHKIDRTTYKHKRDDMILLSNTTVHVFAPKKGKLKFSLPLAELRGVSVSRYYDGICVLHTSGTLKGDKGDMIFDTPHVIEFVTCLNRAINELRKKSADLPEIPINIEDEITHERVGGKSGVIHFKVDNYEKSPYSAVPKNGQKSLLVTTPAINTTNEFKRAMSSSMRLRAQTMSPGSEDELGN